MNPHRLFVMTYVVSSVIKALSSRIRTLVQAEVAMGHHCGYELFTFILVQTASTSVRLGRSVK